MNKPFKRSLNAKEPYLCIISTCTPGFRHLFCAEQQKWSHFEMEPARPLRRCRPARSARWSSALGQRASILGRQQGRDFPSKGLKAVRFHLASTLHDKGSTNLALLVSTNEIFFKTTDLIFLLFYPHKNPQFPLVIKTLFGFLPKSVYPNYNSLIPKKRFAS